MASFRAKGPAIGTTAWLQNERDQVEQVIGLEREEFGYVVRNELDWLNEHMTEIFSNGNIDLKDIMKTPGKLRGKTPRTARKRDPFIARQPLTDIFAPNAQTTQLMLSPPKLRDMSQNTGFAIAEDMDVAVERQAHAPGRANSPLRVGKPGYIDSGYHGMTEDEMEMETGIRSGTTTEQSTQQNESQVVPVSDTQGRPKRLPEDSADTGPLSDESFMSAKEDLPGRTQSAARSASEKISTSRMHGAEAHEKELSLETQEHVIGTNTTTDHEKLDEDMDDASSVHSASESSPERPLARKSSFAFASLPARDTRTASRSTGIRESQVHAPADREIVSAQSHVPTLNTATDSEPIIERESENEPVINDGAASQAKTSTQLLQERITLLGKFKDAKTIKDLSSGTDAQVSYPRLPETSVDKINTKTDAVDVDQTTTSQHHEAAPPVQRHASVEHDEEIPELRRGPVHQKSYSTIQIPAVERANTLNLVHKKSSSVADLAYSIFPSAAASTTPTGSPLSKRFDGTLSASKNKFWSAVKSAKSIFASSATTSAAAKLEAHDASPTLTRAPQRDPILESRPVSVFSIPTTLSSDNELKRTASQNTARPSRKSNESDKKREKEIKAQQKADLALEKAREKERKTAARQKAEKAKQEASNAMQTAKAAYNNDAGDARDDGNTTAEPSTAAVLRSQASSRSVRQQKQEVASRPAPVSVRLASHSQRVAPATSQSSFSKSQHESSMVPPPPPPKSHLRTNSVQNNGLGPASQSNARLRAAEAAARKKEAEEKALQKKAEQKRELDRRRAAKAEEERRIEEERKAAEQQRLQEARQAALRKAEQTAAEAKRKEQARLEQARLQEELQKQKAAQELAENIRRQQLQQQQQQQQPAAPSQTRLEVGGTLRQLIKTVPAESLSRSIIHTNPAKPAKRNLQDEEEDYQQNNQRPTLARGPPSYQQTDAKRRRTNEEHEGANERHSVMAPPKRPSNMRKEGTLTKFPLGYTHAAPSAVHHPVSLFKSAAASMQQHQQQQQQQHAVRQLPSHPSQTIQLSNARVPFAENLNPPVHTQMHNGYDPNKFRTPGRPVHPTKPAKSSPLYPNPDNIQLPEIQTDSEDEDSEEDERARTGFRVPSWVASPALRDLLTQQQLVDPESVFGPIGELRMEEVFKNGKQDRLKRFRDRGSSAAWVESGDAVTSAEKRKDMEARERVAREGGWSFRPALQH